MGSKRFGGVLFIVYPHDHEPLHIHAFVGDGEVVVELLPTGTVTIADRDDAVRGTKSSEVRKVLIIAQAHLDELVELWKGMHP